MSAGLINPVQCPLCEKMVNPDYLTKHVACAHAYRKYADFDDFHVCWCGLFTGLDCDLQEHWNRQGGILAHYLSVQLGVYVHDDLNTY